MKTRRDAVDQYLGVWLMEEQRFNALRELVLGMDLGKHVAERHGVDSGVYTPLSMEDDDEPETEEQRRARVAENEARLRSSLQVGAAAVLKSGPGIYTYAVEDGVGVLEISGVMAKYGSSLSGAMSTVRMRRTLETVARDGDVKSVVMKIESPGGTAAGTMELADAVRGLAASKPVYAQIEDLGASAAYWTASAATKVFANPTAFVGSIGTMMMVYDVSGAFAQGGVKALAFKTGDYKAAAAWGTEVTDKQKAYFQQTVDDINSFFLDAVGSGRRMDAERVKGVADGRVHIASRALELGLIDGVQGMAETLRGAVRHAGTGDGGRVTGIGNLSGKSADGLPAALSIQQKEKSIMDGLKELTAEQLKAGRPDLTAGLVSEGVTAERRRCAAITKAASEFKNPELGAKLIADGVSEGDALHALKDAKIAAMAKETPVNPGANDDPEAGASAPSTVNDEERYAKEFARDKKAQSEFPDAKHYAAYRRAEESGRVKVSHAS